MFESVFRKVESGPTMGTGLKLNNQDSDIHPRGTEWIEEKGPTRENGQKTQERSFVRSFSERKDHWAMSATQPDMILARKWAILTVSLLAWLFSFFFFFILFIVLFSWPSPNLWLVCSTRSKRPSEKKRSQKPRPSIRPRRRRRGLRHHVSWQREAPSFSPMVHGTRRHTIKGTLVPCPPR